MIGFGLIGGAGASGRAGVAPGRGNGCGGGGCAASAALNNRTNGVPDMSRLYDLQKFCHAHADWLIETIEALVRIESPSDDKVAVDRCGDELAARLEAIGGRVTRFPQTARGDHLRVEFAEGPAEARRPVLSGARPVLLLGPLYNVWPVAALELMTL